jgi:UDP-3-O-[3-hydroxymyristoyl] glucosamine N-acyltransferase
MNEQIKETAIHPSAQVHSEAVIGPRTTIDACVVIGPNVTIGEDCTICSGAVIGAPPFANAKGSLFDIEIGSGTLIGCNTTIQYGVSRSTKIGQKCWVNHGCCLGHDIQIGNDVQLGLSTTISGHSEVGDGVKIGPGCTLTNRSQVGDRATIGIGSLVLHPVRPGTTVLGRPAEPRDQYLKATHSLRELLDIERPSSRITGGGNRIFRMIPPRVRKQIRRLLGKT